MAGLQLTEVPSPAKRPKLSGEDASELKQQREPRPSSTAADKTSSRPARPQKCADFAVSHLEDFYKANPPFRQPIEVGSFSFDSQGQQQLDRSELRWYSPAGKSGMDLKVGYKQYQQKLNQTPDLTNILTWASHNWACFLPKLRGQGSVEGEHRLSESDTTKTTNPTPSGSADTASNTTTETTSDKFQHRPDNLLTNFISWRGLLTKLLCTPYNKREPWRMVATLHNSTIYLRELETEENREREANMSAREKELCYWGLKFEDYMTSKNKPSTAASGTLSQQERPGPVNPLKAFCTVVRTRLNTHSIVMGAEVDCADYGSKEKSPNNYVELKTSRSIYTDRNKASFRRYKLQKWWAQSYLVGVPKIVCGFRDDNGIIQNVQTFKTMDIPRECQNDLSMWQASVCLNFLDELLKWVRETVIEDDPKMTYLIEWNRPFTHISAKLEPVTPDTIVLPDWYVNKEQPPLPTPPPSTSSST